MPKPVVGMFPNQMAFIRWGVGGKRLLWIVGGPGTTISLTSRFPPTTGTDPRQSRRGAPRHRAAALRV